MNQTEIREDRMLGPQQPSCMRRFEMAEEGWRHAAVRPASHGSWLASQTDQSSRGKSGCKGDIR